MNSRLLKYLAPVSFLALGSCASVPPAEYRRLANSVKEIKFANTSCKEIGSFDGGEAGMNLTQAKEALFYKIAKAGGNKVVVDLGSATTYGSASGKTVSGTGYRCED